MPRAHLSKRLPDADAIQLFAEHHITQVRRRKNGEIVAVKHIQFGWIEPETFYQLQKLHDFMPLIQEFIAGGYRAKAWLWSLNVSILGISVPFGASIPVIEVYNLYQELTRSKTILVTRHVHYDAGQVVHVPAGYYFDQYKGLSQWSPLDHTRPPPERDVTVLATIDQDVPDHTEIVPDIHWDWVLIRLYALIGPWGDVIQILDSILYTQNLATKAIEDYLNHPLWFLFWGPASYLLFGPPPIG